MTLEREIEAYFVSECKKLGAEVRKLTWIGRRGAPDRVVFYHGVYFVELKRPGGKLRPEQQREHARLGPHADVRVIDSVGGVDGFIENIKRNRNNVGVARPHVAA